MLNAANSKYRDRPWRIRTPDNKWCRLYKKWHGMRARCYAKSNGNYAEYGGRGIRVCRQWHQYAEFREWALANGFAKDLTIDRIDPDRDYSPENCRWISLRENLDARRIAVGSRHGSARLHESDVLRIRELLAKGVGQQDLASWFGVTSKTICDIHRGKTWRHV